MPTIGTVSSQSLRGQQPRTFASKEYYLTLSYDFLAMLVGIIDGDGYIAITKVYQKDLYSITLVLAVEGADIRILEYIQSVLRIGTISYYPVTNTAKYIINKRDLQEVSVLSFTITLQALLSYCNPTTTV